MMMFFYLGLECTYGGWISSFAVLTQVANRQQATIYPSLFWVLMTIFRIGLAFLPGSGHKKLRIQIEANIGSGIISLVLIYMGHTQLACYLSAVMFGFSMSTIYPLILLFPSEVGLHTEDRQTSNIVMAGVIS
jgi:fucose permease